MYIGSKAKNNDNLLSIYYSLLIYCKELNVLPFLKQNIPNDFCNILCSTNSLETLSFLKYIFNIISDICTETLKYYYNFNYYTSLLLKTLEYPKYLPQFPLDKQEIVEKYYLCISINLDMYI